MAYYKAYQTKQRAQEVAAKIRKPGNTPRGYQYPIRVTVQPVKNPRDEWLWGVYYYQKY